MQSPGSLSRYQLDPKKQGGYSITPYPPSFGKISVNAWSEPVLFAYNVNTLELFIALGQINDELDESNDADHDGWNTQQDPAKNPYA